MAPSPWTLYPFLPSGGRREMFSPVLVCTVATGEGHYDPVRFRKPFMLAVTPAINPFLQARFIIPVAVIIALTIVFRERTKSSSKKRRYRNRSRFPESPSVLDTVFTVMLEAMAAVAKSIFRLFHRRTSAQWPRSVSIQKSAAPLDETPVRLLTQRPTSPPMPYTRQPYLFSKAEKSFYLVLLQSIPEGYAVFPKIRIADVLAVRNGAFRWYHHFNRIAQKHLDFVVCDKRNYEPLLVIELDDRSHELSDRRDRDAFVQDAVMAAQLPLVRVQARKGYVVADLQRAIVPILEREQQHSRHATASSGK